MQNSDQRWSFSWTCLCNNQSNHHRSPEKCKEIWGPFWKTFQEYTTYTRLQWWLSYKLCSACWTMLRFWWNQIKDVVILDCQSIQSKQIIVKWKKRKLKVHRFAGWVNNTLCQTSKNKQGKGGSWVTSYQIRPVSNFPVSGLLDLYPPVVPLILKLQLCYMTRRKVQSKIQACNLKIEPQTYVMSGATLHVL